ncbi:MAG: cytochrome c, partial [Bacteroidales bacterium]
VLVLLLSVIFLYNCGGTGEQKQSGGTEKPAQAAQTNPGDPMNNKGIGPVRKILLEEINPTMAAEGEQIYKEKCLACHKPQDKFVGPAPKGILDRRSPEWIMNMILNPEEMVKSDPIAKKLLVEYNLAPMANQHLTAEQARKVLEYFRTLK